MRAPSLSSGNSRCIPPRTKREIGARQRTMLTYNLRARRLRECVRGTTDIQPPAALLNRGDIMLFWHRWFRELSHITLCSDHYHACGVHLRRILVALSDTLWRKDGCAMVVTAGHCIRHFLLYLHGRHLGRISAAADPDQLSRPHRPSRERHQFGVQPDCNTRRCLPLLAGRSASCGRWR